MSLWRFNLSFLFLETLLVALCAGAVRLYPFYLPEDAQVHLAIFLVGVTSGCAAVGGIFLRPDIGAIVGTIAAAALAPWWFLIHASAAC